MVRLRPNANQTTCMKQRVLIFILAFIFLQAIESSHADSSPGSAYGQSIPAFQPLADDASNTHNKSEGTEEIAMFAVHLKPKGVLQVWLHREVVSHRHQVMLRFERPISTKLKMRDIGIRVFEKGGKWIPILDPMPAEHPVVYVTSPGGLQFHVPVYRLNDDPKQPPKTIQIELLGHKYDASF